MTVCFFFLLFIFVIFGCDLSEACFFLMVDRKEVDLDVQGDGRDCEEYRKVKLLSGI